MELRGLQLFADRVAQYKEDLVLQLWALQLVKNYTRGGIDVLVNAGAVELLVRAMQLHKHDALRRDAMQALHAILANKESRERAAEIVSKAGGVEEVLEILALLDEKRSPWLFVRPQAGVSGRQAKFRRVRSRLYRRRGLQVNIRWISFERL